MNTPVIVLLGHFGDLCIILPLLKQRADQTGSPQPIVVARNYASLLEGVSYVDPVIYDGDWMRGKSLDANKAAAEFAKSKFPDCKLTFLNPIEGDPPKVMDNFVKEMWHLAGSVGGWNTLPLVFDRRDLHREAKLAGKIAMAKPIILAALDGISSPFLKKPELMASLKARFKHWKVVDMSTVKAEKPYDLLGLFDRAALLVSIDTMHLHLSRASNVPVIALSRDMPGKWYGTPWSNRYAFHCRYSQYDRRKEELLQAADDALTGHPKVWTMPVSGIMEDAYNPAIVQWQGLTLFGYRYHPDRSWRTQLRLAVLGDNLALKEDHALKMPPEIVNYSHEDQRFFVHQGKLMMSYTVAIPGDDQTRKPRCVIQYGELVHQSGQWQIIDACHPNYGHNDWTDREKNWLFFSHEDKIHFIYQCDPEQVVLELNGANATACYTSEAPKWAYGPIRGGTAPMLYKGRWIRFFHSCQYGRYYAGACEVEMTPPFRTIKVSNAPIVAGHEWMCGAPHWKANVAIPYGAYVDGDKIVLSIGINDCRACVSVLEERQLRL